MWRRLPSLCGLAGPPSVHRRLRLPTRSLWSSTCVLRSTPRASSHTQDDFFVDIDSLAGFSDAPQQGSTTTPAQSSSSEVLGVVRHIPEDEGAQYSRLNILLPEKEVDEEGEGGRDAHLRSNTRAGLHYGEEARYADTSAGPPAATSHDNSALNQASAVQTVNGEDDDGRLPDPERLPYDDERFAAMLLEMEVNGVIDETWQDAKKAHLEDVKEIADILTSLKVRDICCIDVSEKTSNFDYMMFGTCEGARHIHLAAWAAQDADKVQRISKVKRKQTDELWEVVPIGRIVLNLMVESFREEMTLERKWAVTRAMDPLSAANAPISEGRQVKAHGLWTLTLNLQDLEDFEVDYCKDILMRQM